MKSSFVQKAAIGLLVNSTLWTMLLANSFAQDLGGYQSGDSEQASQIGPKPKPSRSPSPSPSASPSVSPSPAGFALQSTKSALGTFLTDGAGRSLYLFLGDSGGTSNCTGACAYAWPPFSSTSGQLPPASGAVQSGLIGISTRSDGSLQVTYNGQPLYYFLGDRSAGETHGQDVDAFGSTFYLVQPNGTPLTTSPSPSPSGSPNPSPSPSPSVSPSPSPSPS